MALILCLETATEICSVGLGAAGELIVLEEAPEPMDHAARLTACIGKCMERAGRTLQELEAIAVSQGPGSYTSLRIGYSTAKGMAYALDIPILEIDTLQALAAGAREKFRGEGVLYCPMIDARRMEVYYALYAEDGRQIAPPQAAVLEAGMFNAWYEQGYRLVFTGNGAEKFRQVGAHPDAVFLPLPASAAAFPALAEEQYREKRWADTAYCEPFYLKPPNITQAKKIF